MKREAEVGDIGDMAKGPLGLLWNAIPFVGIMIFGMVMAIAAGPLGAPVLRPVGSAIAAIMALAVASMTVLAGGVAILLAWPKARTARDGR